MKQTNLLKTFLLLCALVVGSTCAWADEESVDFTEQGYTNQQEIASYVGTNFSIAFNKGTNTNAPKYYTNGTAIRVYAGNYFTVSSTNNITKIELTFGSSDGANAITTDVVTYENGTWSGSAKSVTFTVGGTTGNRRIAGVKVTYTPVFVPKHNVTFSVNGATTTSELSEGADIVFPANPAAIGGKGFKGWVTTAIDGNVDVEPTYVNTESQTVGNDDITYYAVFAKASTEEGNATLTITKDTENFPTSYGTANTFTEYTLEGKKFKIQQAYINGGKLQWRASGNSNGTGTMYNTEAINKIQSVALTYNSSDGSKNFTVEIGDEENPTGGTAITPTNSGLVYTFDCSTYNKNYFVLTNGTGAGYLDKIVITYKGTVTVYSAYCTTVTVSTPAVTAAGWATYVTPYNMEFAEGDAFVVSAATASTATLAPVTKIGANKAVLLKGEGVKTATVLNEAPEAVANELAISTGGEIDGFVLAKKNDKVGFYKWNGGSLTSGKVYLPAPAGARDYLEFSFDETTALTLVNSEKRTVNSDIYNLAGQRVANPTKGLYIVNGKKVVIK